ncbi:hypothetical protein EDC96DRAFT_589564 [Choanephora cucurbitarum]|nr:hypothetical protein EDC96DRAFT_589564 [Choanephora cucurbitarum]
MKSLRSANLLVTHIGRSSRPRLVTSRQFATMPQSGGSGGGFSPLLWIGCISLGGAFTYYQKQRGRPYRSFTHRKKGHDVNQSAQGKKTNQNSQEAKKLGKPAVSDAPKKNIDYQQLMSENISVVYDDGSYGPILLRLAWHSSGSGGTMRFNAEASHLCYQWSCACSGTVHKHIKPKYPELSYGDLRIDAGENKYGAKGVDHARDIFYRMVLMYWVVVILIAVVLRGPWHEAPLSSTMVISSPFLAENGLRKFT